MSSLKRGSAAKKRELLDAHSTPILYLLHPLSMNTAALDAFFGPVLVSLIVIALLIFIGKAVFAKTESVIIYEFQKGLLFKKGKFIKVLDVGNYYVKSGALWRETLYPIDMRENSFTVNGQEILTKDHISIKINMLVHYKITDPKKIYLSHYNYYDRMYQEVQLTARSFLSTLAIEEVLEKKNSLNEELAQTVKEKIKAYGVEILRVEIKDIILGAELRESFSKGLKAKKEAEAALISAREKVATARALANAAEIIKKDPMILRLRELDIAQEAARTPGNTLVVRVGAVEEVTH